MESLTVIWRLQDEKQGPEKLRLEKEELERRRKEGPNLYTNNKNNVSAAFACEALNVLISLFFCLSCL